MRKIKIDTMEYHRPVLLHESINGLNLNPNGTYVDVTFGGGGHSQEILDQLTNGKLFAFDQDDDALANDIQDERFTLIKANFRYLKRFLKVHGATQVDGILADLGISSHQIDKASRGFSTRFNAALDMRMDANNNKSAATFIKTTNTESLQQILSSYGEVRNAKTLAQAIIQQKDNINTTAALMAICNAHCIGNPARYAAQVFQAIRIEVNDEMGALEELLAQSIEVLAPKGRLVVISYHSLEDSLVKKFMKAGNAAGKHEKDFYGNINKPFKTLTKQPIVASATELEENKRSRSAKLRIAERTTL